MFRKGIIDLSAGETMVKGINEIIDEITDLHKRYELYIEAESVLSWLANHNHNSTRIRYDERKQTLKFRRVSLALFEDKTSSKRTVEDKSRFYPLNDPINHTSLIAAACFAYLQAIEEITTTKRDKTGRYTKNQKGRQIWSDKWEEIWCAQSAIEELAKIKERTDGERIPRKETYRSLSGICEIYSSMLLDDLTQKLEVNDFKVDRLFYLAL